jgi:hypothetical protein
MAVPPRFPGRRHREKADLLRHPLLLPPSARLAAFTYEITDILEAGEPDLPNFHATLKPVGSWAVIYPCAGEVRTESLAEPWFRLLQQLDGKTPAFTMATALGIPAHEAREFLAFAYAEGIVIFA